MATFQSISHSDGDILDRAVAALSNDGIIVTRMVAPVLDLCETVLAIISEARLVEGDEYAWFTFRNYSKETIRYAIPSDIGVMKNSATNDTTSSGWLSSNQGLVIFTNKLISNYSTSNDKQLEGTYQIIGLPNKDGGDPANPYLYPLIHFSSDGAAADRKQNIDFAKSWAFQDIECGEEISRAKGGDYMVTVDGCGASSQDPSDASHYYPEVSNIMFQIDL